MARPLQCIAIRIAPEMTMQMKRHAIPLFVAAALATASFPHAAFAKGGGAGGAGQCGRVQRFT